MPTQQVTASLSADLLDAARRTMGLPDGTPTSQIVRAALLRLTGQPNADGAPVNRGGRPKGYSPKRATSTTNP